MSHDRVPGLLHACSEARLVGLKHYTLAFDSLVESPKRFGFTDVKFTMTTPPKIYIHWSVDVICPFHRSTHRNKEIRKDLYRKPFEKIALCRENVNWLSDEIL